MQNFQKLTFLENSFNKDKSVGLVHKKNHEICNLGEVVAAQFYYSYSSKIANQRPLFGIWPA